MIPSISFVIPAFNSEDTVTEAMQSAMRQSRSDVEVIVVDDGSTDATFERASCCADARCTILRTDNNGVGAARNLGLRIARGAYVCFLDSDDVISSNYADSMFQAQGEHDVVLCGLEYCRPNLEPTGWLHEPSIGDWTIENLSRFNQFAIGGLLFRTDFLRRVDQLHAGAFPERSLAEDWEFLLRCVSGGARATSAREPIYFYRLREDSRSGGWEDLWRAGAATIEKWAGPSRELALREWSLRMLARTAVGGRLALSRTLMASLGRVDAGDVPCLAGALRWNIRRLQVARPIDFVSGQLVDAAASMLMLLGIEDSHLAEVRRLAGVTDWGTFALDIARQLGPGEELVLFGYGRNGNEAGRALQRAGFRFSIIDDNAVCQPANGKPMRIQDLCPRHVVLITPDEQRDIRVRLQGSRARVVAPALNERFIGSRAA